MQHTDDLASAWTLRGIDFLNQNTRETLRASLRCFDRALELRKALPLPLNVWSRFGLAAGWMNRADALTRLGAPEQLSAALGAHEQALFHLGHLPLDEHPAFRRRLAIAWMNRGHTLQTRATRQDLEAAVACFEQTLSVLAAAPVEIDDLAAIRAAALVNLGNALLAWDPAHAARAWHAADAAQALLARLSRRVVAAAEIDLKARQVQCRAAAELLRKDGPSNPLDLVGDVTNAVEDGLALVRQWEGQGVTSFRALALELFRFGARVYLAYQPHFLPEFLLEQVDAQPAVAPERRGPAWDGAVREILRHAFTQISAESFRSVRTPRFERLLAQLQDLCRVEALVEQPTTRPVRFSSRRLL